MKIFIVGNNEKNLKKLSENIKRLLNIEIYNITNSSIDEINKIIIKNKKWIITSINNKNIDIPSFSSSKIIYLNMNNDNELIEYIKKYKSKIIIIKSKKEEKILLKSVEEGHEFML